MTSNRISRATECRVCESSELYTFLELGEMPPANAFVESPDVEERRFPLDVVVCQSCDHVQLQYTVDRELLFTDYPYFSSASDPLNEHFGAYAAQLESRFLDPGDFVLEIGSNDGVLLSQLGDDLERLGVDPAENVSEEARERGVETITAFFDDEVAAEVHETRGPAEAIVANNVVGHVDDLHGLMRGIDRLLAPEGVFVLEVPYLVDLLNGMEFDTIYHEHISYFSIRALTRLVEQFGMEVFDVERRDIHGGSIRAFVQRQSADRSVATIVSALTRLELATGLDDEATYDDFAARVERFRTRLTRLLDGLKADGATIVGYGAPAKGNVLLNFCDVSTETLDFLIDTTPAKQYTYSPVTNIPVRPPDAFHEARPDYALLLAWNYRDAILDKETSFRERGGRFVLPIPNLDVV